MADRQRVEGMRLRRSGWMSLFQRFKIYVRFSRITGLMFTQAYAAGTPSLEVWPESHWPGFALRKADVIPV